MDGYEFESLPNDHKLLASIVSRCGVLLDMPELILVEWWRHRWEMDKDIHRNLIGYDLKRAAEQLERRLAWQEMSYALI